MSWASACFRLTTRIVASTGKETLKEDAAAPLAVPASQSVKDGGLFPEKSAFY
jgi:hypothetical protein